MLATCSGIFGVLEGAHDGTRGWLINKDTVAKYVDKAAPSVGDTKLALIKPGKLLKLVGKGLGDDPLDILAQGAPQGLGHAIYAVANGGEESVHCTVFAQSLDDRDYNVLSLATSPEFEETRRVPAVKEQLERLRLPR